MVATTTALLAMGIASAAASTTKAVLDSKAANKATKAQQSAIDKSLEVQREIWGQKQQMYKPYTAAGQSASNLLGSLMKPPGAPGAYQVQPPRQYLPPGANAGRVPMPGDSGGEGPIARPNFAPRPMVPPPPGYAPPPGYDPRLWGAR